jgi:hypothetical protein
MTMLEILSENRDLKAQVQEAEHMLARIDIEKMPSAEKCSPPWPWIPASEPG